MIDSINHCNKSSYTLPEMACCLSDQLTEAEEEKKTHNRLLTVHLTLAKDKQFFPNKCVFFFFPLTSNPKALPEFQLLRTDYAVCIMRVCFSQISVTSPHAHSWVSALRRDR